MKFYRILYSDDIVSANSLRWVPWSLAGVREPDDYIIEMIIKLNDANDTKFVFFFPETNIEGFEEIKYIFTCRDIPFVTKEVDYEEPNIIWEDKTQTVVEISVDEWKSERKLIEGLTIPVSSEHS